MKKIQLIKGYIKITFKIFQAFLNLIGGVWKLTKLQNSPITIFGGTHLSEDSIYIPKAKQLAHYLANHKIPILTGGGPGVMQAASCGADSKTNLSISLHLKGVDKHYKNECFHIKIELDYFFSRKWLLLEYSIAFIAFPGGYGTLNEITEVLTMIQIKKRKPASVILIGVNYWKPLIELFKKSMLENGLITEHDLELFILTDSIDEAADAITNIYKKTNKLIFQ